MNSKSIEEKRRKFQLAQAKDEEYLKILRRFDGMIFDDEDSTKIKNQVLQETSPT